MNQPDTPKPLPQSATARRARELRAQGLSTKAIAEQLGVTTSTVLTYAPSNEPAIRYTAAQRATVRKLYRQGHTPTAIGKKTGFSLGYIVKLVADLPRQRPRITPDMARRIAELREQGMTIQAVSRELKICQDTVVRHSKPSGLKEARAANAQQARELRALGLSTDAIASKLGIKPTTAEKYAPSSEERHCPDDYTATGT